jgi:hypothetical protein
LAPPSIPFETPLWEVAFGFEAAFAFALLPPALVLRELFALLVFV